MIERLSNRMVLSETCLVAVMKPHLIFFRATSSKREKNGTFERIEIIRK